MKWVLPFLLLLLISSGSAEVFLSPDDWTFEVTAGNSHVEDINVVRYEGNETEIGFSYNVTRNGEDISEGVNISTDPETVILDTGETKEVEVTVDTNYRLSPGEVVVEMSSGSINEEDVPEEEETEEDNQQTGGSGGGSGGQPPPNQGEDSEDEDQDGESSGNQEDGESERNESQENNPEEETENLLDDIENEYQEEESESQRFVPVNIAVSFSLGIMVLLLGIL